MRKRLAKKIIQHRKRYSRGRYAKALGRYGWRLATFEFLLTDVVQRSVEVDVKPVPLVYGEVRWQS